MTQLINRLRRRLGFGPARSLSGRAAKSVRSDALSCFDTVTGRYYLPSDAHGDVIARAIKANQVFDKEIVDVARAHIKPATAVLDVGANFGQMSILFSNMVGEEGKVYSFDADDFVFAILSKNIDANNRNGRIVPVFGAVHEIPGQTLYFPVQDFVRFDTYGSYGIDYNARTGRKVPTITIDSLEIAQPISFMKVDVQGSDLPAMKGARKTIERHRMPIIFEYEYQFEDEYKLSFQEYVDFVRDIGYRFAKVINGFNYLILPR
jgi:FkbM family methyltransferase